MGSDALAKSNDSILAPNQNGPDLYLMGSGICFPEHLSMQTLEAMEMCKAIYTNLTDAELHYMPHHLRGRCVSVWSLYQDNRNRSFNYEDIAQTVSQTVNGDGAAVGWLTQGHPTVFDSVTQDLLATAERRDWSVSVVPAVSCIDTVLAQVGYDPANGLMILEAAACVSQTIALQPQMATLLLQPSAFGSSLAHYRDGWEPDLGPLRDHLLQFFEPGHPCAFVRSASRQSGSPHAQWGPIDGMAAIPFEALAASTLFIPAAGARA